MPTYNYACESCNHEFEEQLKITDRNLPTESPCPNCGLVTIKKVVGNTPNPMLDPMKLGRIKPSEGFRDVLRNIKKNNPLGNINII